MLLTILLIIGFIVFCAASLLLGFLLGYATCRREDTQEHWTFRYRSAKNN